MFCKTRDRLNIYYELHGKQDASQTIIFLNGLTQSTLAWTLMLDRFKEYRIVLMDFIFQGNSDKVSEWRNFDQHAEDLVGVLQHVGAAKSHVVGLSYGSLVAQHLAVRFPLCIDKLVLLSTFAHKTPYYEAIEVSWWRALEAGGYNLLLDVMLPTVLSEEYFSHPLVPIQAMKEARKELNQNKEALFNLMRATREREDYRNELRKITVETLVIQGEKDLLLPVHLGKEVAKNIPKSKFVSLPDAGHTLNLEHYDTVAMQILKFIS